MRTPTVAGKRASCGTLVLVGLCAAACGIDLGLGGWDGDPWGATGTLVVENDARSTERIVEVDFRQQGVPDWGAPGQVVDVAPGATVEIALFPTVWDVKITWADTTVDVFESVAISMGDSTRVVGLRP